jgi:hypothetical protein
LAQVVLRVIILHRCAAALAATPYLVQLPLPEVVVAVLDSFQGNMLVHLEDQAVVVLF